MINYNSTTAKDIFDRFIVCKSPISCQAKYFFVNNISCVEFRFPIFIVQDVITPTWVMLDKNLYIFWITTSSAT